MTGTATSVGSGSTDPAGLLELAEAAARAGGGIVAEHRADPTVSGTKSSPTDLVTLTDRAVEEALRRRLASARPDDGVLGEEAGFRPGRSGLTWVLDPIDGTVNFVRGLPAFVVSVAVVEGDPTVPGGWSPVAGCVHHPPSGQTWTARAGAGARLDGVRLRLEEPPELEEALVATGFGYLAERRRRQARVMAALLPEVGDIRRFGSAAFDLCLLASGRVDAFYESGLNVWDVAAAALIVAEAGAEVTGLAGEPPGPGMVLAARAPLHGVLASRLEALGAADR